MTAPNAWIAEQAEATLRAAGPLITQPRIDAITAAVRDLY